MYLTLELLLCLQKRRKVGLNLGDIFQPKQFCEVISTAKYKTSISDCTKCAATPQHAEHIVSWSSRSSPALLGKVLIKQSYKLYRFFLLALPSDLKLHNLLAHFFLQVCRHDSIFLYPIPDCRFLPVLLHHLHLEPAPENKSCIAWRGNTGENAQK